MNIKKLYQNAFNFERRTLQLDSHNDGLSNIDYCMLKEKLAHEPSISSIAKKFQIKLAQQNSDPPEPNKAEINEKIRQMISNPKTDDQSNYDRDLAKALEEWIAKHPNFTPTELEIEADKWNQANATKYDRRTELQKSRGLDELNLPGNTQEQEFAQQDRDIQQFLDKEKIDKATQQQSVQGKTPFNIQDAATIINSFATEIKTIASKSTGQKIMFIFLSNGNVGITGQDQKLVGIIRQRVSTPLQLAVRAYLTNYKKYFTNPINYELIL